jgi:hypothetical protein
MKDNTGSLFKNDRKETERHPDFTGQCMVGGTEYWFKAWIKNANDPSKKTFMSFAFDPKEERPTANGGDISVQLHNNLDDEIPF